MFNELTALAFGIVTFAVVIGVGVVVLTRFGQSSLECVAGNSTMDTTNWVCMDIANNSITSDAIDLGGANATSGYLGGQLGQGGLAGWTPAIIALTIGMLFLGLFLGGMGSKSRKY